MEKMRTIATRMFRQYFAVSYLLEELMDRTETDKLLDFISEKFLEECSVDEILQGHTRTSTDVLDEYDDYTKAEIISVLFQMNPDEAKEYLEKDKEEYSFE